MGEENKEEKKEEGKKEGKKEEEKKDESKKEGKEAEAAAPPPPPEIVLKVDMHCEACARKIARALKGFQGVEEVIADSKSNKVVVKGKAADPAKVCERLQKKSGRKVELISPLPKPPEEKNSEEEKKEEPKEEKKEEPPAPVTVVLSVRMHCEACAELLKRRVRKIKGVESVETDLNNDKVIVKGIVEPQMLVDYVKKRTRKHASIVKDEEKKEGGEKKDEEKKEEPKDGSKDGNPEKKQGEGGEDGKDDEDKYKTDIKRSEYWPLKDSMEYYAYPYAPQIFSDENPNACSVM